jgi:hypothetical protein
MPGSDTAATSQCHGDGGDADDDFLTVLHEGIVSVLHVASDGHHVTVPIEC